MQTLGLEHGRAGRSDAFYVGQRGSRGPAEIALSVQCGHETPVRSLLLLCAAAFGADLRIGIIGTDTSHVIAFTKILNDPTNKDHIPGARVVAAYKGGSKDIEDSCQPRRQVRRRAEDEWNVEIVPDIADALQESGRGAARKRRRTRAPGAGQAGDRRPQAAVHRQTAGRHAGGRARNRPAGQGRGTYRGSAPPACATATSRPQ